MRIWRRKILYTQKVDGSNDVGPEIPMGFSNGMGQIGPMMGGSVLIKKIKEQPRHFVRGSNMTLTRS
jgi:hypothetical protein